MFRNIFVSYLFTHPADFRQGYWDEGQDPAYVQCEGKYYGLV